MCVLMITYMVYTHYQMQQVLFDNNVIIAELGRILHCDILISHHAIVLHISNI